MAALATQISSRPQCCHAAATMAWPLPGSAASEYSATASPPAAVIWSATWSAGAPVRVHHAVAVVDHDLRALPGQRQAERPPETPPAAGDDRHPPGQRPGAVVGSRPGRHPLRPGVQVSRPNPPRGDELVRAVRSVSSTKASATTAPWFVTFLAVATLALASRGPARPVRKALAGGRHQVADSAAHSILPLASGALCPPARLRGALPSRSPPGAFAAPPSFVAPQPGRNPAGRGIPRRAMRSS